MKLNIILSAALLAGTSLFSAHASEGEPIDAAELQQQLEQARQDLAEAAQRMARLQRELIQGSTDSDSQLWSSGEAASVNLPLDLDIDISTDKIQRMMMFTLPPRLGVVLGDAGSEDRNRVLGLTPGSGAEQSGLQEGDRLISINGVDVTDETSQRIQQALAERKPGDSVDVLVRRGETEERLMPVVLSSPLTSPDQLRQQLRPMMEQIQQQTFRIDSDATTPRPPLPTSLSGLGGSTHLISNHLGLKPYFGTADGVVVLHIDEDNSLNLQSGDVVLKVDGNSVNRPVDFGRSLLSREHGEAITLQVMRQGALTEVDGLVPEQALPGSGARRIEVIRQRSEPDVS